MWVSGSLIRSSTWRSSSVSAPCISSSICLPSSPREVAHDARQLLPGIADRLHPRLHDAFLQLGGDVGEPLQRHLELGVLVAAGDLQQLVAGQHQLGDHGHQMFQRVDIDADRLVGDLVGFLDVGRRSTVLRRLCSFDRPWPWRRGCGGRDRLRRPARRRPARVSAGAGATSIAVSRKARSSSSSETSPGRSGRSSICRTSVPCVDRGLQPAAPAHDRRRRGFGRGRRRHRGHAALDHLLQLRRSDPRRCLRARPRWLPAGRGFP